MPVLAIFIIISLSFYVFYKVKTVRTKRPVEKRWLSSKSSIALGLFVILFGVNQLFLFSTTTTYIVAAVFVIIGGLSVFGGIKAYKYFLPLVLEEAAQLNKK